MNNSASIIYLPEENPELPSIKEVEERLSGNQNSSVIIQHGDWHYNAVSSFVSYVKEWNEQKYFLRKNPHPFLLKDIQNIVFNKITLLAIQDNEIASLEPLSRIWMPNLYSLGIERNKIKTLRNVRKWASPKLSDFGIAGNMIEDCQVMSRFQSTSLGMIGIETSGLKEQGSDIRWLAKLQTKKLTHIYFRSSERIRNYTQNILKEIKRKHLQIDGRLHNIDEERGINLRI